MKNIIEIYEKYFIPERLQMHMLRVAACANLIIDNWNGKDLDKDAIIKVSLLHDMGNIIKITDLENMTTDFIKIREKYVKKYGENDHPLNLEIAEIEGLNKKELMILDEKRSRNNEKNVKTDSFEIKICSYCDQRVSPTGVVGIKERLEDVRKRYASKSLSAWSNKENADKLTNCALEIERQIMQFCNVKPEYINDKNIKPYIEKLRKYMI